MLAAVLLFAFGVVVGRGSITSRSGTALPATAPSTTAAAPTSQASTLSTRSSTPASAADDTSATSTWAPTAGDSFEATLDADPWPTMSGACGNPIPMPFIDGLGPPAASVEAKLVAGGYPARVDLGAHTVDSPLAFTPDGTWLIVAINDGEATRLLLYTADGDGPYDPGVSVPGPALWPLVAEVPSGGGSR